MTIPNRPVLFAHVTEIAWAAAEGHKLKPRLINLADVLHIGLEDLPGKYPVMIYFRGGQLPAMNIAETAQDVIASFAGSNILTVRTTDHAER